MNLLKNLLTVHEILVKFVCCIFCILIPHFVVTLNFGSVEFICMYVYIYVCVCCSACMYVCMRVYVCMFVHYVGMHVYMPFSDHTVV